MLWHYGNPGLSLSTLWHFRTIISILSGVCNGLSTCMSLANQKEEDQALKQAFSVFLVKLYGFCLSTAYIARVDAIPT